MNTLSQYIETCWAPIRVLNENIADYTHCVITINYQLRGLYRGEHRNLRDFLRKTRLFKGK